MEEQNELDPASGKVLRNKNALTLAVVGVAVVAILLIAGYFIVKNRSAGLPTAESEASEAGFGGEINRRVEEPAQKAAGAPNTNPLGNVESNPYSGYKNPFSR